MSPFTRSVVRVTAIATALVTFAFLVVHDSFHVTNVFLVPDLLLVLALLVGGCLPPRFTVPLLLPTFGAAAGVFTVSVASFAVHGEVRWASLVGVAACLVAVVALSRHTEPEPAVGPEPVADEPVTGAGDGSRSRTSRSRTSR